MANNDHTSFVGAPPLSKEKKEKEKQKTEDNLNILLATTYLIRQTPLLIGQKLSNCVNKFYQPMCCLQKTDEKIKSCSQVTNKKMNEDQSGKHMQKGNQSTMNTRPSRIQDKMNSMRQ